MSADYEVRGGVAVITLNNPPVNGLGLDTRKGISDGLDRAQADAAVKAIVITGAGRAFSGGADIREFGKPQALAVNGGSIAIGHPYGMSGQRLTGHALIEGRRRGGEARVRHDVRGRRDGGGGSVRGVVISFKHLLSAAAEALPTQADTAFPLEQA